MRNILLLFSTIVVILSPLTSFTVDRTEAQRHYDLGMSYLMSELYEQGLETLNQVAFLYPDSDVADDALYQLAMIRESVGDGKVVIAEIQSLELQEDLIKRSAERFGKAVELHSQASNNTQRLIISLALYLADIADKSKTNRIEDIITAPTKRRAIAQYLTALDYLDILTTRYPESNKIKEVETMIERVLGEIEVLLPKDPEPEHQKIFNKIALGVFSGFAIFIILKVF